ncbi:MAG: ATP-binding protein [Ardenticatenaceae bacterium]|nr:ATP-binding protein [Ardenticatenaceae bacterium]
MDLLWILLAQSIVYAIFPFLFTTLPYYLRSTAFYIYISIVLVLGGFLGSLYSFPITDSITISGGNLAYSVFMMTIILLVMVENNLDVIRNVIRLVVVVNGFVLLMFPTFSWALANPLVDNPFNTAPTLFSVSIGFVILGGILIIVELLAFLFIFERVKRYIKNITVLTFFYSFFYVITLALDGLLFPLIAFNSNPELVQIIAGNVSGKIVTAAIFTIPIIAFLFVYRGRFVEFVETPLIFSDLLKRSRQALEVALQESEKRYQLLVDTSPMAIAIYQKGTIAFANKTTSELLGLTHVNQILGQPISSFFPNDDARLERLLKGEKDLYPVEESITRPDGTQIPVEIDAVPFVYEGEPAVQIIARDIQERKLAEAAEKQTLLLQIELEKERELRELKSRFVSMVVHDFRNPVTAIQLSAELIPRHIARENDERVSEILNTITATTNQLNELIDYVLEIGRLEKVRETFAPQTQDIVDFCRYIFSVYEEQSEGSKHTLSFETEVEAQDLSFDSQMLERALGNLFSNARKYSPDGGLIKMRLSKSADAFQIQLSDEGIGIAEEEIKNIFNFFHRAENALEIQGTGLGLTIVKQIVAVHEGNITCQSKIYEGTTFTISLPL